MKKLIIANWKMRLSQRESLALAKSFADKIKPGKNLVALAPDYLALAQVGKIIKGRMKLASQDSAPASRGAITGEISPLDLKSLGVTYAIIGHSERRLQLGESSEIVRRKAEAALLAGLASIVCVGEARRPKSPSASWAEISGQLKDSLNGLELKSKDKLLVAYEPAWAISTAKGAKAMSPEAAQATHKNIKAWLRRRFSREISVLYGGSVDAKNASNYLVQPDIDGLLVGGASLSQEFISLCRL